MTDKTEIEEKDLPPFFKQKIKELDTKSDDELLYGKKGMKQIYMDAYAVAQHCGNLLSLRFFAHKDPLKQEKLVPQLAKSNHSGASFGMVITCAREYLTSQTRNPLTRALFSRKKTERNGS